MDDDGASTWISGDFNEATCSASIHVNINQLINLALKSVIRVPGFTVLPARFCFVTSCFLILLL